jgi:iron complex transport system ATP-binding protein
VPLAASNLSFAYLPGRPVLRGLSLAVRPGSVLALCGPNGCGKSTLLRLLAGLLTPDQGSISLAGRPPDEMPPADRARLLAYLPQQPEVALSYPVRRVVAFGRLARDGSASHPAVDAALAAVDLTDRAGDPFPTLSVGQRHRAALARCLAQLGWPEPAGTVLLADEPTAALDPAHALAVLDLFRAFAAAGGAVVAAMHDLTAARRVADDAALLDGAGTLAATGPAAEVLIPDRLNPVFATAFLEVPVPGNPPALLAHARP